MAKKKDEAIRINVSYGNVNIGDETARLGISISRRDMTLTQADQRLCGRRLKGKILARSSGGSGQESLPGLDQDVTVEATFDVKSFTAKRKWIVSSLVMSTADASLSDLGSFARREGVLTIDEIEEMPDPATTGTAAAGEGDE